MIEIKNLSKSYGDNKIYDNFCLDLEQNSITCLMGASGSGKTTLLNVIARLVPFGGEVPELNCSYIFQSPALVPNLTVYGNLALVCGDRQKIVDMIERVGLGGKENSYPVQLSGGEAQRVSVARAFLHRSDILLMDEPFSSLDIKLKKQITELFFELWNADKRTVLAVTHDVDGAVYMAQRILVLSKGKIVYDVKPQTPVPRDIKTSYKIRESVLENLLI